MAREEAHRGMNGHLALHTCLLTARSKVTSSLYTVLGCWTILRVIVPGDPGESVLVWFYY